MPRSLYVSAYAAMPAVNLADQADRAFLSHLARNRAISGLEWPFYAGSQTLGDEGVRSALPERWRIIVTSLPGVMTRLAEDPAFGLASDDGRGRQQALDFISALHRAVIRWGVGDRPQGVCGVEIHSSPRVTKAISSSAVSFSRSLREIRSWDWQGIPLFVEHCDAHTELHGSDKGFLSLENEMTAIAASAGERTEAKLVINWGRSAIEARGAAGPLIHLRAALRRGLLGGLVFSGCTEEDQNYGAWADRHAPFADIEEPWGCRRSLLTQEQVAASLRLLPGGAWVGLKIQPLPPEITMENRLTMIERHQHAITTALDSAAQ